jgi:hypothetical protein|tara:strand:+ start:139 stop:699 length:561 start_codon:yes stop_codon:yes gene_type:complete
MSNFIGIYEKAAPLDYCHKMINAHLELQKTCSSNADRGEDTNNGITNRKDLSFYFERDCPVLAEETNHILDACLEQYIGEHVGLARLGIFSKVVKVQETKKGGGFHKWHHELGYGDSAGRVLAWAIYLNTLNEDEGETEYIEQGVRVKAEAGKVVLFPAAWTHTHRGNPPYSQSKYIATGWYYTSE